MARQLVLSLLMSAMGEILESLPVSGLLHILYQDEHMVAVDKPVSLLVHRTRQSRDHVYAVQLLRDQLNQYVYPAHRLDRPTSGVLIFALNQEMASSLSALFEKREVKKTYLAVVRGLLEEHGDIHRPLKDAERHDQVAAEASTSYRRLAFTELSQAVSTLTERHYSLAEVTPHTGRMHQIRKHFRSIAHPLIGDTRYGKGDHNRLFRDHFGVGRLLLHASSVEFIHPETGQPLRIVSTLPQDVRGLTAELFPEYEPAKT